MSVPVTSTPDQRALITAELRAGERLLWVGQSDPSKMLGFHDRWLVPFSVLFAAAVTTGLVLAIRDGAHPLVLVLLAVFVVASLHMGGGRFLVKRHRKRTEVYAVTDQRALIVSGRASRETDIRRTDRGTDLMDEHVSVEWNDTGDLDTLFWGGTDAIRQYANTGLDGLFGVRRDFAFYDVADVVGLLDALEEIAPR
ncbi:hypothetical protein [Curtobacterium sp. ME12]|uniref:hypothetical protein n=1 Tax=Curtobacterium sp. ME12 TaxID=2744253 RepID=UPI0015F4880C|nr:hypothetical protein [Curtobacterium sp. ME12]